jgi:hypothetical protein
MPMMTPHQSDFIHCSRPSDLETPSNMNDEEGEFEQQQLSFRQSKVFADFGKEDLEWSYGRDM